MRRIVLLILCLLPVAGKATTPQEVRRWVDMYDYSRPLLVQAIIKKESSFNPLAFNPEKSGSYGLMQIQCDLAKDKRLESPLKYSCDQLFQAQINVRFGIQYLQLIEETLIDVNIDNILAAYNGGFDIKSKVCAKESQTSRCLKWKMNPRRCKHYNVFRYEGFNAMECYPGEYINQEYVWKVKRYYSYLNYLENKGNLPQ